MSFLRSVPLRIALVLAVMGASLAVTPPAGSHVDPDHDPDDPTTEPSGPPLFLAHDESLFESIAAPFACGTEWSGQTRPGHGQNDWNLDFNRTSLDFGVNRQHDLGQPLFAQDDGTVTFIGWQVNAGTYLDIDYGDYGVRYIHLIDDSVVPELGDSVTQGETIALLGDTGNTPGFAHLHLEYWDSRSFEDARIWELKQAGQPQTEVTFDGNVIDPGEVVVSTNCVGEALTAGDDTDPASEPLDILAGEAADLIEPTDGLALLAERLDTSGASGADPAEPAVFTQPEGMLARVDGTDLADETILVVAHRQSTSRCDPDADSCVSVTRNGAPTVAALAALDRIVEAAPRRTVVVAFVDDADADGTTLASLLDSAGADVDRDALIDSVVAALHLGPLGEVAAVRLRNDTLTTSNAAVGIADLVEAPGQPNDLRWWSFAEAPTPDPDLHVLRGLGVPVFSIADAPGPCATGDNRDGADINVPKLELQIDAITSAVLALAAADSAPELTAVTNRDALIADAEELLALMEETGRGLVSDASVITEFLADPPEPLTTDDETAVREAMGAVIAELLDSDCAPFSAPAPFTDLRATSFAIADVALLYDLSITVGTSATTYSPAEFVTREQMAAFLARIWRFFHPDAAPTIEMPFDDVAETSFAYDDIRLLFELGVTVGTSDTTYSPADSVTREQMAAFLARIWRLLFPTLDTTMIDTHPFDDLDETSFAYDDVSLIYDLEITVGTSDTTYSPADDVTREQMAAFLARILRRHATDEPE